MQRTLPRRVQSCMPHYISFHQSAGRAFGFDTREEATAILGTPEKVLHLIQIKVLVPDGATRLNLTRSVAFGFGGEGSRRYTMEFSERTAVVRLRNKKVCGFTDSDVHSCA